MLEVVAVAECVLANIGYGLRDDDLPQFAHALEGTMVDPSESLGQCDALDIITAIKCIFFDANHGDGLSIHQNVGGYAYLA